MTEIDAYYNGSNNKYKDDASGLTIVKIFSGDYYVTKAKDEVLVTILGSCISACIRDPIAQIGGMNHFLLPATEESKNNILDSDSTKYGVYAMEKLLNELFKLGAIKSRLEIKIFGGANITSSKYLIGSRNIDFVRNFLKNDGYKIIAENVGGNCPRKLHYFPISGKVMMKAVPTQEEQTIITKEKSYATTISTTSNKGGEVDLFE